eukprot:Plantae.Rhodophyta-Hildenbrandia_rubra.ctg7603.p1 GENE.Plantae.Rhodophyta-Hildenbrandia_rubra.ctg7603~~Plantae.Rhodophyta-Hildenbrandia_rubra.ctg7603.p1  ORF type:complete len:276 (-),score=46.99 Plantae.Rhodophyta-Hildenbrandia_rubra.ctg7603:686-1513(-)
MKKRLLLIEMTGTLLYRSQEPIPGAEGIRIRNKYHYRRAGVLQLLDNLHRSGKYVICVYSSMNDRNLKDVVDAILPRWGRGFDYHLDQKYHKKDPEGEAEWQKMRDLEKVWNDPRFRSFDITSTILVDSEKRTCRDTPKNVILVKKCVAEDIESGDDSVLMNLKNFLVKLVKDDPVDIRSYFAARQSSEDDGTDPEGIVEGMAGLELGPGISVMFVCAHNGLLTYRSLFDRIKVKIPLESLPASIRFDREINLQWLEKLSIDGVSIEKESVARSG